MRRRFSKDPTGADAVVWGIPFDAATSNRPGARFGPQAIRRASAIFDNDPQYPFARDLFAEMSVIDYGDCLLDYGNHAATPAAIERQANTLLDSGAFLLTLGGDHFITWPLLKAHVARHGPLAMVQFDAHQDTWTDEAGRIDHGSFVGRAVRDGLIDASRSIQIGIRTQAPEDCGIEMIHGYEVEDMTASDIAARILARTAGAPAYLTFDIDCLDPAYAPGTGTPVAGARRAPKYYRCCSGCHRSISGARMSSRWRQPTTTPISPPLRAPRWQCICSDRMPGDWRQAAEAVVIILNQVDGILIP